MNPQHILAARQAVDRLVEIGKRPDPALERRAPAVSDWSVSQQLEHLARADLAIWLRTREVLADPSAGLPPRRTWIGWLLLTVGRIPRGRGRAPSAVRATSMAPAAVRELVDRCARELHELLARDTELAGCRVGFRHPYFGVLSLDQWMAFVAMHHRHHERIIADIDRRSPPGTEAADP